MKPFSKVTIVVEERTEKNKETKFGGWFCRWFNGSRWQRNLHS